MWYWIRKWLIFYNYRGNWHGKGFANWPPNPRKMLFRSSLGYFLQLGHLCNELPEDSYMLSQQSGFFLARICNWWPLGYAVKDNTNSAWVTSIIPDSKNVAMWHPGLVGGGPSHERQVWPFGWKFSVTRTMHLKKSMLCPTHAGTLTENHPLHSLEHTRQKIGGLPQAIVTRAGRHGRS